VARVAMKHGRVVRIIALAPRTRNPLYVAHVMPPRCPRPGSRDRVFSPGSPARWPT
jgi:hypothetical protein